MLLDIPEIIPKLVYPRKNYSTHLSVLYHRMITYRILYIIAVTKSGLSA
jgi:hypothetical protein